MSEIEIPLTTTVTKMVQGALVVDSLVTFGLPAAPWR